LHFWPYARFLQFKGGTVNTPIGELGIFIIVRNTFPHKSHLTNKSL